MIVIRFFATLAAIVPLGGCTSLSGPIFAHFKHKGHHVAAPDDRSTAATTEGRQYLATDNPGLAIESFHRALANGEPVAPALNGLGVGYARLGRSDLASRYFEQAVAADPSEGRYLKNLVHLMMTEPRPHGRSVAPAPIAAEGRPVLGPMQRLSRLEVRIVTQVPGALEGKTQLYKNDRLGSLQQTRAGNLPQGGGAKPRNAATDFKPPVKVVFADRKPVVTANFPIEDKTGTSLKAEN